MLEDLREVMQEETQDFIDKLSKEAEYPIEHTFITYGALNEHITDVCRKYAIDLVIYGNHNHSFFTRFLFREKRHSYQPWTFFWFR